MNLPTVSDSNAILSGNSGQPQGPEKVIQLEDVSVRYRVPNQRFVTLKEYVIQMLQGKVRYRDHWALSSVDLSIFKSEVIGLIGPNGAGKSTLLKVISRVLKPTKGHVWVKGQVAPLLSVGAGFHPELTGRENVFLNGTLLGFSHQQMEEKFDRIVDFAELGDFIDAPLRTYSTGMRARLGFAVATDSQPDILIVDEVLSVGDSAFQEKSAARMESYRSAGATVLLVSHSMASIRRMCTRSIWISRGKIRQVGNTEEVVEAYLNSGETR